MARLKIGQLPPGGAPVAPARKGLRFGFVKRLGGEVGQSVKRIGAKTEEATTSATRAHLQAVEKGVEEALQPATVAEQGGPEEQAAYVDSVQEQAQEELAGVADYIGGLMDAGDHDTAMALVGELEDALQIVKNCSVTIRAPRRPEGRGPGTAMAPTFVPPGPGFSPADEGPISVPAVPSVPGTSGLVHIGQINPAVLAQYGPEAYADEPDSEPDGGPVFLEPGGPSIIRLGPGRPARKAARWAKKHPRKARKIRRAVRRRRR
jgi:hypothetical protein